MRILLLEDDPVLGEVIESYLAEFYDVVRVYDAQEAQTRLDDERFDLFIFDINLPGRNGLAYLEELRTFGIYTPTIVVTAYETLEYMRKSFEAGAHDMLRKPFELEELRLRIERSRKLFHLDTDEAIELGEEMRYYPKYKRLEIAGKTYTLKPKEAEMLAYFLAHPKRLISHEELSSNLWEYDAMPEEATLRSYIRNLRALIGASRIVTERGRGWRYEPA